MYQITNITLGPVAVKITETPHGEEKEVIFAAGAVKVSHAMTESMQWARGRKLITFEDVEPSKKPAKSVAPIATPKPQADKA
jgi:hypothetical protein